jgi:hypothetical protein
MVAFTLSSAAGRRTGFCFDLEFVDSVRLFGEAVLVRCVLPDFAWLNAVAPF